jgi:hypothetical protein
MSNKALCVGINEYPGGQDDLKGCVNDAKGWAGLLVEHYGFPRSDVKVLLDADATKAKMVAGLKTLLAAAKSGDRLVFTNASHGTYVADDSGDEEYDEAICPYDCDKHLLIDDELRELFTGLPAGVSLSVISDSCHSGTLTRAAVADSSPGAPVKDDRRVRFLNPAHLGKRVLKDPGKAKTRGRQRYPQAQMKEILLSGCDPTEYSYDALIEGTYHGALTATALAAIRAANYEITWQHLHARVRSLLDAADYPQHPQLEGSSANKKKRIFS